MARSYVPALAAASVFSGAACVADPDLTEAPAGDPTCASAPRDRWTGTAARDSESGYPDHLAATVAWQRTRTVGCVDTLAPAGTVAYDHAIPGALCQQSITPDARAIAAEDGTLTIDRTTDPPTYVARAATTWEVTFRCTFDDGTVEEHTFDGGGTWIDAAGTVEDGAIADAADAGDCGPAGVPPCTYAWSFAAE